MRDLFNKNYVKNIVLVISIILMVAFSGRLITTFDENYTLELMQHSIKGIVSIDTIDVHPPLYYILLKLYLSLFTSWTDSIFIKIISARILSLILSLVTFILLYKSLRLLNILIDWRYSLFAFIILPNVTGINAMNNEQLVDIRMYSLAALLISTIFYFTIKYNKVNSNKYVIFITIFAIFSFYTNYYAGLISGLIILFNFIKYFHNKKDCIMFFMSGIIFGIVCMLWLPVLIHQAKASDNIFYSTTDDTIKQCIVLVAFIVIFIYPFIWDKLILHSFIFKQIIFVIFISSSITILISFIKNPMFRFRYLYPILLIFEFISVNIVLNKLNKNSRNLVSIRKLYSGIVIFLIIFSVGISLFDQIRYYYPQSVQFYRNCNIYRSSMKKHIRLNPKNNVLNGSTQTSINTEYAFYLTSIDKYVNCKGLNIPDAKDYLPLYNKTIKHVNN